MLSSLHSDGELVSGVGAGDGDLDGVMEGEEGGGWEVGDDDLELPPDLVSEQVPVLFTTKLIVTNADASLAYVHGIVD